MSEQAGHFDRFNALFDHGWLGVLSALELKVWYAYEKHAGKDGAGAFPSLERLASHLGHANPGHIRMARKRLVDLGLFERTDDGRGGRGRAEVRVLVPPPEAERVAAALRIGGGSESVGGTEPEHAPNARAQGVPEARALPVPEARALGARIPCAASKEEQPLEHPREQPREQSSVGCANGASPPRPQAADVSDAITSRAKVTRLRNPATPGELARARAFIDWFAREVAIACPDEPFDTATVELDRVVTKLRFNTIGGSLERLKTAARLYLDERREDGHPIDRWRPRLLSDEQVEKAKTLADWYAATWPRYHDGEAYEFIGSRDVPAAQAFLKRQMIEWDLELAKDVALCFLATPEIYNTRDHLLPVLAHYGNHYAREHKKRQANGTSHMIGLVAPSGRGVANVARPERSADRIARLLEQRLSAAEKTA